MLLKLQGPTNVTPIKQTPMYRTVTVLKNWGIFDFVVPFLLIFALVYGVTSSVKLFGKGIEGKASRGMVSFLVGLVFMYASSFVRFGTVMAELVAKASLILLALFLGMVIAAMFGIKWRK